MPMISFNAREGSCLQGLLWLLTEKSQSETEIGVAICIVSCYIIFCETIINNYEILTFIDAKMRVSVQVTKWLIVHPSEMGQRVRSFVNMIREVGASQNFNLPEPR